MILGYRFWQNHLSSDPDIIGKTLKLDNVPHVVVGIAPDQFEATSVFREETLCSARTVSASRTDRNVRFDRGKEWLHIHGRLSPGSVLRRRARRLPASQRDWPNEYPATNEFKAGIVAAYDPLGYSSFAIPAS